MIKSDKVKGNAEDIKEICRAMKAIEQSITGIGSNLAISSSSAEQIRKRLKLIDEQILNEAVKMDSLSDALLCIAELYERTERQIVNNGQGNELVLDSAEAVEDTEGSWLDSWLESTKEWIQSIRDWLVEHGFIKPEKQERVAGEAVTEHQEIEQDLYMQWEIERLNKDERFSKATWDAATVDERKNILNEYIKEVSSIMGLSISGITFINQASVNGMVTMGSYSHSNTTVRINEWVIANGDANNFSSYSLFTTVVHELRHAYQHAAVDNPDAFVVTQETIDKWEKSFDEYKTAGGFMDEGMSQQDAFEAYRNQEVEKDARSFAKQD